MSTVSFRITDSMLEDLEAAAEHAGMTRSEFVRHAVLWAIYGAQPQEAVE